LGSSRSGPPIQSAIPGADGRKPSGGLNQPKAIRGRRAPQAAGMVLKVALKFNIAFIRIWRQYIDGQFVRKMHK